MNVRKLIYALYFPLYLTACVTINVYFPAAAAEQAADRIIEDIIGRQGGEGKGGAPAPSPDSGLQKFDDTLLSAGGAVLDFLIPATHAAQADLSIDTPAIRRLQAAMKRRYRQLEPHLRSGAIGFTSDALVGIRDPQAVPLKERSNLKKLLVQENRDRNALYKEIARANAHPEWEADIRSTFARRWPRNAAAGTWYQDASGSWRQK